MCTIQLVIRVNVVLELPQRPAIRVMTRFAARTQAVFMHIIRLMTDIAFTRCRFVCRREVALFARRYGMQPEQWKPRHIVFETHLAPAVFVMAFLAAFPNLPAVYIICPMATETFGCKFFLVNLTLMTG
jgi:hypothetical protein